MSLMYLGHGISKPVSITSSIPSIPIVAMASGQSLIDDLFDDAGSDGSYEGYDAFVAAVSGSDFFDGAVGNSPLLKSTGDQIGENPWVDNSGAPADGTHLSNYLAICDANTTSRTDINCVIWQQGNAERSYITEDGAGTGESTPAEYEAGLDYLISRFRAEHGADVKIIFGLPHRRTSGTDQHNYAFQKIREIYANKADSDPNIFAVEHCDLDLADATHHTTASKAEFGARLGAMANYALNGGAAPDYPVLQSATIDYGIITAVFDSDITAPSSGVGQCAGAQNFTEKTGTALIRTGVNTVEFTLDDNEGIRIDDTPEFRVGSGVNASLASTNADTLNNASGTLPARAKTVTLTDGNVISSISDVKEYWDARYSTKTYSSGSIISTIEGIKGAGMEAHPNGASTGPIYDASLFGGRGGLYAHANNSSLQLIEDIASGVGKTVFIVLDFPASTSNYYFSGFANADSSLESRARLLLHSGGNINYSRDQSDAFPTIISDPRGTQGILCLRYNANDDMDYYWNSASALGSIDPHNNYSSKARFQLFANGTTTSGAVDLGVGAFVLAETALTDGEVSTIMTELASEFGITLS